MPISGNCRPREWSRNRMRPWIAALLSGQPPGSDLRPARRRRAGIRRRPDRAGWGRRSTPIFERFRTEQHVPGLVYGIVADGRLVYVRAMGSLTQDPARVATPDSLFRIASMTKAFTALAILNLRDEGRLQLDAPAETYVPEMRGWHYPTSDSPAHPRPRPADPCRRLRHRRSLGRPADADARSGIHRDAAPRHALHPCAGMADGIFQPRLRPARPDRHQRLGQALQGLHRAGDACARSA